MDFSSQTTLLALVFLLFLSFSRIGSCSSPDAEMAFSRNFSNFRSSSDYMKKPHNNDKPVPRPTKILPRDILNIYQRDENGDIIPLSDDSELWYFVLRSGASLSLDSVKRFVELFFSHGAEKVCHWIKAGIIKFWIDPKRLKKLESQMPLHAFYEVRRYGQDEHDKDLEDYQKAMTDYFGGNVPMETDSNGNFPSIRQYRKRNKLLYWDILGKFDHHDHERRRIHRYRRHKRSGSLVNTRDLQSPALDENYSCNSGLSFGFEIDDVRGRRRFPFA